MTTTLANKELEQSSRSPFSQDRSEQKPDLFHNAILAVLKPAQATEVIDWRKAKEAVTLCQLKNKSSEFDFGMRTYDFFG